MLQTSKRTPTSLSLEAPNFGQCTVNIRVSHMYTHRHRYGHRHGQAATGNKRARARERERERERERGRDREGESNRLGSRRMQVEAVRVVLAGLS